MKIPTEIIPNYGILASISWNSNNWADHPTEDDLKKSHFGFVKENASMHESLNFGHEILPAEKSGIYIGYIPRFNRLPDPENSKNVNIIFFVSSDYHNNKNRSIVGFYAYPIFGEEYVRWANHQLFEQYNSGNVAAHPKDIIYFKTPVVIDEDNVLKDHLLPIGKNLSKMGFNYLDSDNVFNILSIAFAKNPSDKKLENFLNRFPLAIAFAKEISELDDYLEVIKDKDADSLESIKKLENKMKKAIPEVKTRIASFIERGAIAKKVKQLNQFQCQICKAQNLTPTSFKKPDGIFYIEAHHVEPVSNKKAGSLSMANIITVCANHHRQLHYGNAYLKFDNESTFEFSIDGQSLEISKAKI